MRSEPDHARLKTWQSLFSDSSELLWQLGFDGSAFEDADGRRMRLGDCEDVRVFRVRISHLPDLSLAHHSSWLHANLDGGKDHRFSHNRLVHWAVIASVRINGTLVVERDVQLKSEDEAERIVPRLRGLFSLARQVDSSAILDEYMRLNARFDEIDRDAADVDAEHTRRRIEGAVRIVRERGAGAVGTPIADLPGDVREELTRLERSHAALLQEKEKIENLMLRLRVGLSHMIREMP